MSFAYLPLFTGDYIRDTRHLTPMRHGVFLLALMYCWDSKGPMPLDEQECAGICNCRSADEVDALRYVLGKYFVRMVDGHYNRRMALEVEKSEAISGARSNAGKLGALAKAKHLPSKSQASAKQVPLSPSPSPSLTPAPPASQAGVAPQDPPAPTALSGKPARKRADKPAGGGVLAWGGYSSAYEKRYGVEPVRNASVNAKLAMFAGKIGEAESADVARFYVGHQNRLYVGAMHPVDLLLRDAERLRTEWATGRTVTSTQATQADKTQTNANVFGPMIEQARREEADAKR